MPRTTPPDRLQHLLAAAAAEFVAHGFERTQMDDVARRLGVSKGTVYRSVDSKEALFVGVIGYGDRPERAPTDRPLDDRDALAAARGLRATLAHRLGSSRLATVLQQPHESAADFAAEIVKIADDLFQALSEHRVGIMVLDRCAPDLPEVATEWFGAGRYALVDAISAYLVQRAHHLPHDISVDVLARSIVELITTWSVKIPWDPAPRDLPVDISSACSAMVRNLVMGAPQ